MLSQSVADVPLLIVKLREKCGVTSNIQHSAFKVSKMSTMQNRDITKSILSAFSPRLNKQPSKSPTKPPSQLSQINVQPIQ